MTKGIIVLFYIFLCHLVYGYKQGDPVLIQYNKISSAYQQLAYPYASLDFVCPPTQPKRQKSFLVFDQDLRGDRLVQSDFKVNFLKKVECRTLCKHSLTVEDAIKIQELISNEFTVEWEIDGIPGVTVSYTNEAPEHKYKVGFPLGFIKSETYYLNNHVTFQIIYKKVKSKHYEIIGFEVYPDSIIEGECTKNNVDYEHQEINGRRTQITYTYSIQWKEDKAPDLWDRYLLPPNPTLHQTQHHQTVCYSLISLGALLLILYKTRDETEDGWRSIHRDLFRRPDRYNLLMCLLGTGLQLGTICVGLILSLMMGWYHPAEPRTLTRWFLIYGMIGSVPSGYVITRFNKVFRGKRWIWYSLGVPCFFLCLLFISSCISWLRQSSYAISLNGWIRMMIMIGLTLPFQWIGCMIGEKSERIEVPRTSQIARMILKRKGRWIKILVSGFIPFLCFVIDWHEFLLSSYRSEYTLSIDNLIYSCLLNLVLNTEITLILIFLQLCSEDYHWWWQSFMMGGSISIYMFVYSIIFMYKWTNIQGLMNGTIYALTMLIECSLIGLCTGSIGFMTSCIFIKTIYSTTKRDLK